MTAAADPLVERARAGDAAAFAEIVRLYEGPVFRAALAALGSREEAEEAAQDAFVAAFRRLDTFRGDSSLKTWLVAIAWRKALTRRRRLRFRSLYAVNPRSEDDVNHVDVAMDPAAGAQEMVLTRELRQHLAKLIQRLPGKLRDALLLIASGQHTYEDAAAILGVPVGTAKWRVAEARRVLREKLRAMGYDR
jgi:RNA polymerase sigma-70 factor (ECF subfamily)